MKRVAFPDDPKHEHPDDCPWHYDWHACSCGALDVRRLETLARRIADQLDSASEVLRQDPVTFSDLERVRRQLEAEARLLELIARQS